jgi:phenylpropionate dioxygenase-like ring-hydroxylating dioxygenase large terminal subunit
MFLGHINDILPGFKTPLLQYQNKKSLINVDNTFKLINNVCPHQQSLIISKTQEDLKCQYHGWSWDSNGLPISQGTTKICNKHELRLNDIAKINSLLFSNNIDLSAIDGIDLSYMQLTEERIDIVNADFKHIIDVFVDIDHIPVVHDGVYDKMGITGDTRVEWLYYNWGNLQLIRNSSELDAEYKSTLLGIEDEKITAFWLTVYPHTMIEWQPGAMFITVCVPKKDTTDVVVFKYRDIRYSDLNWKLNSKIWEMAFSQDKHQAESIVNFSNFNPHLEESKIHFRSWMRENGIN